MRLLQFTDTHLFAAPDGQLHGVTTLRSLEACLAHARRRHLPADAILVTGDLVQDEPDGYGALELLLDGFGAPVLLVSGNHDRPDELREAYGDAMERGPQWRAHIAATLKRMPETAAKLAAL